MSDYKQASKQKLRFESTVGLLSVEHLWDLGVEDLDRMAISLDKQYKESGEKSFLVKTSTKNKTIKLKFDIVLDILKTKMDELETLREKLEVKLHNQKILSKIAEARDKELDGKTPEELEKMLK